MAKKRKKTSTKSKLLDAVTAYEEADAEVQRLYKETYPPGTKVRWEMGKRKGKGEVVTFCSTSADYAYFAIRPEGGGNIEHVNARTIMECN